MLESGHDLGFWRFNMNSIDTYGMTWHMMRKRVRLFREKAGLPDEFKGLASVVQIRNPSTNRYVKIDRELGAIMSFKKSKGPYKNIPIARRRRRA